VVVVVIDDDEVLLAGVAPLAEGSVHAARTTTPTVRSTACHRTVPR
jgi:hypothetical protein